MKEIKFRAFDTTSKKMYLSVEIEEYELKTIMKGDTEYTKWMQYTGLKDKNGIEIYEGDILEVKYKNIKKFIGNVFYEKRFACYMVSCHSSCFGVETMGTHINVDVSGIWDEKRELYYEELKASGLDGLYRYCEKKYKVIGKHI